MGVLAKRKFPRVRLAFLAVLGVCAATAFSQLPNGAWQTAKMDSGLGQAHVLSPTAAGGTPFQVRLADVSDVPVDNGALSPPASCAVTMSVVNSWPGGYLTNVTVTNEGSTPIDGWSVSFTVPAGDTVVSTWGANLSQVGQQVTANNASYNGFIAAGGYTTWSFIVNGPNPPPITNPVCEAN